MYHLNSQFNWRFRGAMVARLTPDQKVACSNHVGISNCSFAATTQLQFSSSVHKRTWTQLEPTNSATIFTKSLMDFIIQSIYYSLMLDIINMCIIDQMIEIESNDYGNWTNGLNQWQLNQINGLNQWQLNQMIIPRLDKFILLDCII